MTRKQLIKKLRFWADIAIAICISLVIGMALVYYFFSQYEQCLEDGYSRTVCRSLMMSPNPIGLSLRMQNDK